ncbi:olfactomedin-4-like [Hemiscyllium ocellatum]|uniref:olfactomedin-4-like n=1 Tax=Hemiscyllium ocellatum TaxID=170820 RepID=UPI0029669F61|nr:olfactomedin-4-like [Hemiscyllium ocellatum]
MLFLLLIAATVLPSSGINVNGSINNEGVCYCSVVLSDPPFPVEKMEYLETISERLRISVEQEINKVRQYSRAVSVHSSKLVNLTLRLEKMETGHGYTQLDFELLKLEIQELEALTNQLKQSLNGSNSIIDRLFVEIANISRTINELESFDKQNILAFRKEVALLRKQLADCEKNQAPPTLPPIEKGSCNHNGLLQIGVPTIVRVNYNGVNYKYGGWGKDSVLLPHKKELYWVAPLHTDRRTLYSFRVYNSLNDMLLSTNAITKSLPSSHRAQGSGMVLYNNSLYYNCYNSRDMCRYHIDTGRVQRQTLRSAVFNNRYSYAGTVFQDIDFAVDESGLWVIYCPEANAGNAVIGKINEATFTVEKTWVTKLYKPGVTNSFIICGVLYAIRPVQPKVEEVFYTFDTRNGVENQISVMMRKVPDKLESINYNPADHKLYVYSDGYLVTYDVIFEHKSPMTSPAAN